MYLKCLRVSLRAFGIAVSLAVGFWNYMPSMRALRDLPAVVRVSDDDADASLALAKASGGLVLADSSIAVSAQGDERLRSVSDYSCTYYLFGRIPVKTVQVLHDEAVYFVPGGQAVGITIHTEGVLIVGLGAVDTEAGALSPGSASGLKAGDVIVSAGGETVADSQHLADICKRSNGRVELSLLRGGETIRTDVQLVRDADNQVWRLGVWARDSTAGVGTLSFYDVNTGWFAALGHPVSDVDTGSLLPVRDGRMLHTEIVDVRKGQEGSPGELIGIFSIYDKPIGRIFINTEYGIFGKAEGTEVFEAKAQLPMGYVHDAHTGSAQLVATVSDRGPETFDCEITRVNTQSGVASKGMVIRITDPELLELTGGIVQGM